MTQLTVHLFSSLISSRSFTDVWNKHLKSFYKSINYNLYNSHWQHSVSQLSCTSINFTTVMLSWKYIIWRKCMASASSYGLTDLVMFHYYWLQNEGNKLPQEWVYSWIWASTDIGCVFVLYIFKVQGMVCTALRTYYWSQWQQQCSV
jgi:hypothetical protein